MKSQFVFLCTLMAFIKATHGKNWVLLVAGSNGFENYRHQADICHAYHTVRSHGVPRENVITMMYDDIANNTENPYPGNIINQPDGPNLYPGVVIDYRTSDVNPDTFLAVLSGNKTRAQQLTNGRSSKVIESGPDDHIFVNFVDHGGPGVLNFPATELTANVLMFALKNMYDNKKYKKMVFYVEACYSGSMFEGQLPETSNIYVTTAANAGESSFCCYFDKKRSTYLGDVYSVSWMQDSDKENLRAETLSRQFNFTKKATNTSHVSQYGDKSIEDMLVAEFQGNEVSKRQMPPSPRSPLLDAVPAHEARLQTLRKKLEAAGNRRERDSSSSRKSKT